MRTTPNCRDLYRVTSLSFQTLRVYSGRSPPCRPIVRMNWALSLWSYDVASITARAPRCQGMFQAILSSVTPNTELRIIANVDEDFPTSFGKRRQVRAKLRRMRCIHLGPTLRSRRCPQEATSLFILDSYRVLQQDT